MTLNQKSQSFAWKLLQDLITVNVSEPQNESYRKDARMCPDSPNLNSYSKSTASSWLASSEGKEPSSRSETFVEVS